MHLLHVQPGRRGRREALTIIAPITAVADHTNVTLTTTARPVLLFGCSAVVFSRQNAENSNELLMLRLFCVALISTNAIGILLLGVLVLSLLLRLLLVSSNALRDQLLLPFLLQLIA